MTAAPNGIMASAPIEILVRIGRAGERNETSISRPVRFDLAGRQAERFRFDGDGPSEASIDDVDGLTQARGQFYQDGIEISPLMVPELHRRFRIACERLEVPDELITPFIYSSREIQGECYASGDGGIIRFSSGLIDLLNDSEFEFVVGHELGHFLLSHHSANAGVDHPNLEYFRRRRSQEISCDRIGLIACASLDTALRALMKTVSGLTDRHLRFDFLAFVAQLRKVGASAIDASLTTHPSTLIRAKALLWFSLSEFMSQDTASPRFDAQLRQIDERVSTALQLKMQSRFDRETVDKLRSFLGSLPNVSAEPIVFGKMISARNELETIAPTGIVELVSALSDQCRSIIKGPAVRGTD